MHGLLDCLVDRFLIEPEESADSRRLGRGEMGDVVFPPFVQADGTNEVDLDLVSRNDATDEVATRSSHGLRDGENGGDIVGGVGVIGCQKGVVEVEFAHGRAVRPGRPFGADEVLAGNAEHGGAVVSGVSERHVSRGDHRAAVQ